MVAIAGRWEGVVTLFEVEGPILVTIADAAVNVDLPAIGAVGWTLSDVTVSDTTVEGRLPTGGAVTLRLEEDALVGDSQGPTGALALDLRRPHPDAARYLVDDAAPYPYVDNILVAQGGETVLADYFYGRDANHLHTFQSCTKSVTSLVFGIAVDQGRIASLDDPVWRYLESRTGHRWIDERYDATIHDVLRMSVGLDWNEEVPYTDERNDNTRMNQSGDYVGYTLDRSLRPGWVRDTYEYQSGLVILLGEVLRAATGHYVDDFAREHLFAPLGIDRFVWLAAPDGTRHTGGGLFIRPRDMLAIGQLMLQDGAWNGNQIVSEEWLRVSTSPQTITVVEGHGYQWHLFDVDFEGRQLQLVTAAGYGGQYLHVIRELDAVVVTNAQDYLGDGSTGAILREHVLPTLLERSP